jgi:hypothetical protein
MSAPPLYALCDRRASGEPRTVAEFDDLVDARAACAWLKQQGADCWLEIIPAESIVP